MKKEYAESELACDIDYKAEYYRLKELVEKQNKTLEVLGKDIANKNHIIDKYEAVISCVEAFIGQKIDI